jgi:glycosyltransferase involved in cell wall biosynthesis
MIFDLKANLIVKGVLNSAYCFAVSNQLKEYFIQKGFDSNRIEFLPHGVDLRLFNYKQKSVLNQTEGIPDNKWVLMYTGWVSEKRGLGLMLETIEELCSFSDDYHLVIVGAGKNDIEVVNKFMIDHNVGHAINVFTKVPYNQITSFLSKAKLCLSFLEPNETYMMSPPQKIMEYFAMGKPVIANQIPTHSSLIKHGYNGVLVNELKKELVCNAIMKISRSEKSYNLYSRNAIETAKKNSITIIKSRLVSKLDFIIKRN